MTQDERNEFLISRDQMDIMLQKAAKDGSLEALKQLGLGDENAGQDMREIRSLLDAFRFAKRTVFGALLKWMTVMILGGLLAGGYFHFNGIK